MAFWQPGLSLCRAPGSGFWELSPAPWLETALTLRVASCSHKQTSPAVLPTCLLSLAPGRGAPWPIPRCIEGGHTDHVGCVASQVLEFHTVLSQEERLHPLSEVLPLDFPEINLWETMIVG